MLLSKCLTLSVMLLANSALFAEEPAKKPEPAAPTTPAAPAAPAGAASLKPRVQLVTNRGNITLELDAEKAPATVLNFVQYAEEKFYEGTIFHRVMKGFMIQGGGFTKDVDQKTQGLRAPIKLESNNGLTNAAGTIAMARTGVPDSATAQFFINVVDNASKLDYKPTQSTPNGYAVFGKVVEGQDIVEKIRNTECEIHAKYKTGDGAVTPKEAVVIESVKVLTPLDKEKAKALAEKK